jgi:hypothetical protein
MSEQQPGWWKRQSKGKKFLYTVLGLVVLLVIIIVATTAGGSDTGTAASTSASTESTTASVAETTATTEEAETTTTEAAEWVTVATLSGKTDKAGDNFTLSGAPVRLTYNVTGDMLMAAIYVMDADKNLEADGGFPEITVSEAGSDSTTLRRDAGDYYLQVKAANCSWEVTIEEQQ